MFLGLDANFRLKRKNVSNDIRDSSLSSGWSYFVPNEQYKVHLEKYKGESEPVSLAELLLLPHQNQSFGSLFQKSNCSRHDAVNLSTSKPNRNHAATGVSTVECARHNMKRPNAVGDLQKGERYADLSLIFPYVLTMSRYCNMDYVFYRSLINTKIRDLVVSYDIACQWSINLKTRLQQIDPDFSAINTNHMRVRYLVPKFHLPAHIARCRTKYSFNYSKYVGRTDGEAPERGWAEINPVASSTKEMGPGFRRDTLDSHFGDYNWRKIISLGAEVTSHS